MPSGVVWAMAGTIRLTAGRRRVGEGESPEAAPARHSGSRRGGSGKPGAQNHNPSRLLRRKGECAPLAYAMRVRGSEGKFMPIEKVRRLLQIPASPPNDPLPPFQPTADTTPPSS